MDHLKIAILASGEGTTAEAVIEAAAERKVGFDVSLVLASKEDAGICKRVARLNKKYALNIDCRVAKNDEQIAKALETCQPDLIVLLGYMKKIGLSLVQRYGWRPEYNDACQAMMLNTHPGLLPETKGLYGSHVQRHVLANGLPFGGQTLHIVSENYDEGPTVAEHQVAVQPGDTVETFFERVKKVEKQYLPDDLDQFLNKRRQYLESKNG